ncbi:MAG: inorganic phosphate transporter family protein [Cyanobacteria bacterium REEB67]|nr:inorganic phosphate transporter family protein [Cyanobacteria bacterium REEB67]
MQAYLLFGITLLLGCLFAYTNGFQDGSSVAASPIACRSMTKVMAVVITASFEFCGALFGGSRVASSISQITDYPRDGTFLIVIVCALSGAIIWNFVTRLLRVPSSSTHALVGGLIGAIFASTGNFKYVVFGDFGWLIHPTGVCKVIAALFISPLLGFLAGFVTLHAVRIIFARATSHFSQTLKRMQWLVLPLLAFGHGANDTQKVMGLIVMALSSETFAHGLPAGEIPLWVRLTVGIFMVLGVVAMAPGLVKRVGDGIYRQRPVHGFVTEFASAVVVVTGSAIGGPVSASQVIASTVMGVGYAQRRKGVHWLVAKDMLMAWFLTIPSAGFTAFLIYKIFAPLLNLL